MSHAKRRSLNALRECLLSAASFGVLALQPLGGAMAQDEESAQTGRLEEIIVTARNRAESLQDVPLSITAFTAEDLERQNIQTLSDVARFTPGLAFEDFSGGFATPVIRGQSTTRVTALEGNVATFFDGIYLPRSWAIDVGAVNLQRIEVVKGPQSARYARNAFAGAINYIPRKANLEDHEAELTGTFGSDERRDIGVHGNFVVTDNFAIQGSYDYREFDGTWDNLHPFANGLDLDRGTQGNAGGYERQSASVSVFFQPIERLTIEAAYYYNEQENEYRPARWFAETNGQLNGGAIRFPGTPGSLFVGELPSPGESVVIDPRAFGVHSDTDMVRAEITYDLTEAFTAKYLYGHIEGRVLTGTSGEPEPINCNTVVPLYCNFQAAPNGGINYDSHEARLEYDDGGNLSGAVGFFIQDGRDDFEFYSVNLLPITDETDFARYSLQTGGSFGVTDFFTIRLTNQRTLTDIISGFGEFNWTSDNGRYRFGAEVRYTETEIRVLELDDGVDLDETFRVVTPRVTGEYEILQDTLIFASVARGAKAGGFNAGAVREQDRVFDEETNWTYEVGTKGTYLDGRLTVNGTFYYTDWNDVQINSPDQGANDPNAVNITLNLGDARIFGVELATQVRPTDNLSFDFNFSHADAKYADGTIDARFSRTPPPCDDVVCSSDGDVGGNEIERTPPTQISAGAQWEDVIDSLDWEASYYLRGDVSWQSDFFATSANVGTLPSRTLVNARAGIDFEHVSLSLWAENLFDERYTSSAFVVVLPFGNNYGTFYGERRTFGLTATLRY